MSLYGYDDNVSILKNLADTRRLSHAYAFFGEPQVGKFLCAHSLANYLEYRVFEEPTRPLKETLIIDLVGMQKEEGNSESIGIQAVRDIAYFLRQKPASGPYRTVIIRDAEWLTDQAQNALLKTLEEPPENNLIIIIITDPSVLLPAVSSRLQKMFFKTLSKQEVLDFCNKYDIMKNDRAIQNAFGRIGRLQKLCNPTQQDKTIERIVSHIMQPHQTDADREKIVDTILAFAQKSPQNLMRFCEELLVVLWEKKKYGAVAEAVRLMRNMQTLTLNKRIHLKKLLCLIT